MSTTDHSAIYDAVMSAAKSAASALPAVIADKIVVPCVDEAMSDIDNHLTKSLFFARGAIVLAILFIICIVYAIYKHSWHAAFMGIGAVVVGVSCAAATAYHGAALAALGNPAGISAKLISVAACIKEKSVELIQNDPGALVELGAKILEPTAEQLLPVPLSVTGQGPRHSYEWMGDRYMAVGGFDFAAAAARVRAAAEKAKATLKDVQIKASALMKPALDKFHPVMVQVKTLVDDTQTLITDIQTVCEPGNLLAGEFCDKVKPLLQTITEIDSTLLVLLDPLALLPAAQPGLIGVALSKVTDHLKPVIDDIKEFIHHMQDLLNLVNKFCSESGESTKFCELATKIVEPINATKKQIDEVVSTINIILTSFNMPAINY